MRAMAGRPLPDYLEEEFDAYLKCGRMEEGFPRLHCEQCYDRTQLLPRGEAVAPSAAVRRSCSARALNPTSETDRADF
jgi:hypothetical protein